MSPFRILKIKIHKCFALTFCDIVCYGYHGVNVIIAGPFLLILQKCRDCDVLRFNAKHVNLGSSPLNMFEYFGNFKQIRFILCGKNATPNGITRLKTFSG